MQNIATGSATELETYRKVAIASWKHPRDPSIFCKVDLACEEAMRFMQELGDSVKVTLTHYVAKILGLCLDRYPRVNQVLIRNRLYPREETNIFITTLLRTKGGKDLSGVCLEDVCSAGLEELAERTDRLVKDLRAGRHREMERARRMIARIPSFLYGWFHRIADFFMYTLNLNPRLFGMPRDPFGSAIVTNIGAFGFKEAFIPLSPYSRCPVIVGVGQPYDAPTVRAGEIAVQKTATVSFTFDHRYADGIDGALFLRTFKKMFENPSRYRDALCGG